MNSHDAEPATPPVSSGELLGFPPEARVLIVNCDDLGMHEAVNVAVIDSIEQGIAASCSLMTPCPAAHHALRLLDDRGHAVRVWLQPGRQRMRDQGLPVVDNPFLDSFSLAVQDKALTYSRLLRDLPAGLSEWAVHPSLGTQETHAIDSGWLVRRTDYEFLTSAAARELLRDQEIIVIDYRLIQRAWTGGTSARPH
ncbi:ChbG/HpnK family deacetylase [Nonomuraea cavernae]|uniref:ChbG/HpnK family deacetylase n=1 Tax=Nonomuraea cavernae TaxID=2045107 RepID=UPI00340A30BE